MWKHRGHTIVFQVMILRSAGSSQHATKYTNAPTTTIIDMYNINYTSSANRSSNKLLWGMNKKINSTQRGCVETEKKVTAGLIAGGYIALGLLKWERGLALSWHLQNKMSWYFPVSHIFVLTAFGLQPLESFTFMLVAFSVWWLHIFLCLVIPLHMQFWFFFYSL